MLVWTWVKEYVGVELGEREYVGVELGERESERERVCWCGAG